MKMFVLKERFQVLFIRKYNPQNTESIPGKYYPLISN
jgi:hypothetical protein